MQTGLGGFAPENIFWRDCLLDVLVRRQFLNFVLPINFPETPDNLPVMPFPRSLSGSESGALIF